MSPAQWLGEFVGTAIGHALKICGPTLVDVCALIYRRATTETTEDSKRDESLVQNLTSQLPPKP